MAAPPGAAEPEDPSGAVAPFFLTGHPAADALLARDPLAVLVGMVLDQQVPIEWAFVGPRTLQERLGPAWSVTGIAALPEEEVVAAFCAKPAVHRYPAVMARRVHGVCRALVDDHGGDVTALWRAEPDGAGTGLVGAPELYRRLRRLPGFGDEKARIYLALLAKRFGIRPDGWRAACAPFGDDEPRTAADIDSPAALAAVREWKKQRRAAGRSKAD